MNLYIMHHAIAVEPDDAREDRERPLSERGRKRIEKISRNLLKLDLSFDLIMTSPFLHARQTADLVADTFAIKPKYVVESPNLCPFGSTNQLVEEINERGPFEFLLLVGHEPFLNHLIGTLLAGDASISIELRHAGLCKLSMERLTYGRCATLEWLMTPAQMIAI